MSHLNPDDFGRAATAWGPEFFMIRITQEDDLERLRAAARHEADRDSPRPKRIAQINKRIQRVTASDE
jgi:hypothetical protein